MKHLYLFLMFVLSLSFISCEYKDLCYEHPHRMKVKVEFEWQRISIDIPRWMEVWLFPAEGGKALHFQISDYANGYIHLMPGHYKALCYNGDTQFIHEEVSDDFDSFMLTTNDVQPDRIVCASLPFVDVRLSYDEQVIRFTPEDGVMDVTVTLHHVSNLKSANGLKGMLSGMASGIYVEDFQCTEDYQTLYSDMEKVDSTTIRTQFVSFGHCPMKSKEHIFSLVVPLENGSCNVYHWNVSDRMHDKGQDPRHVVIELDGLELPKDVGSDSGMSTYVDGWQNVWIEL